MKQCSRELLLQSVQLFRAYRDRAKHPVVQTILARCFASTNAAARQHEAVLKTLPAASLLAESTTTLQTLTNFRLCHRQTREYSSTPQAVKRLKISQARAKKFAQKQASAAQETVDENIAVEAQHVVQPAATAAETSQIATAVQHPALVVTRDIEWGTVLLGFEQANYYKVFDEQGSQVALIAEDLGGLGKGVARQLLGRRRSFTATVFSPDGTQILFRVRRPLYLINSNIVIEDGEGNELGEVQQRFSLTKRVYDLYLDKAQFATIQGGFLAWDFKLEDTDGGTLALIDRNFQGFGKELFTDAGKYVIHFGDTPQAAATAAANTIAAAHPNHPTPDVTTLAKFRNPDMLVVPTATGDQLAVVRPLTLSERMIALACAISIDFDYFSQHSNSTGMMPLVPIVPLPVPAGGAAGAEAAGAAAGAGAGDAAGAAAASGVGDAAAAAGGPMAPPTDFPGSSGPAGGWGDSSGGFGTTSGGFDNPGGFGNTSGGFDNPGGFGGAASGSSLGGDEFKPDFSQDEKLDDDSWGSGDGGGDDGEGGSTLWEVIKGFLE